MVEPERVLAVLRGLRDAKPEEWDSMMRSEEGVELSKLWDVLRQHSEERAREAEVRRLDREKMVAHLKSLGFPDTPPSNLVRPGGGPNLWHLEFTYEECQVLIGALYEFIAVRSPVDKYVTERYSYESDPMAKHFDRVMARVELAQELRSRICDARS